MPYQTPFDKMNENYKNRTGSFKDRPSAPPSALDLKIAEYAAKALEKIQQQVNPVNNVREVDRRSAQVAAQDKSFLGARTDFSPTPGYTPEKGAFSVPKGTFTSPRGTFTPPKGAFAPSDYSPSDYSPTTDYSPTPINKDVSTAAQKAIAPLAPLYAADRMMGRVGQAMESGITGMRDRQPEKAGFNAYPAGSTGLPGTYSGRYGTGAQGPATPPDYLKNVPAAAERSMQAQDKPAGYGPLYTKDNQPGTASASTPPGTITSPGAVDDKVKAGMPSDPPMRTTRTPTDQGEQVGTQKAGTTFNGSTAPSTGNRYAEMIAAGPEAQAKFIKDANLVHMIRGTNQTWGNPKIQGDLGVKEFKSALEAAAGIDAPTALTQDEAAKDRAAELEKQKIANQKGRFQPVTETNTITGQEETHMVDTLLNEDIGGVDEIQEVEAAADAWKASDQGEEAQAALKAAIKRFAKQRKYLQYLTSSAATSK